MGHCNWVAPIMDLLVGLSTPRRNYYWPRLKLRGFVALEEQYRCVSIQVPMSKRSSLTGFGQLPPFATATPVAARQAVQAACAYLRSCAAAAAATGGKSGWQGTVGILTRGTERLTRELALLENMHSVIGSSAWDAAYRDAVVRVTRTLSAIGQHRGLYRSYLALRTRVGDRLSSVRRRILTEEIADFEMIGVGLTAARRKQFRANAECLVGLSTSFECNVRDSTASGGVHVRKAAALEHMPTDTRAAHKIQKGWQFGLLDPSYETFMKHCSDRRLRQRMFGLRNARASDLSPAKRNNLKLIRAILDLRRKQARMLGYPNHATAVLARRMAQTPAVVRELLLGLAEPARRRATEELAELADFAAAELGIRKLAPWDLAFASERLFESRYALAEAELRPYLARPRVLRGLFACARELFGVRTVPFEAQVWDEGTEVRELQVDGRAGWLYLDLEARPGKRGGAWAHPIVTRCKIGSQQQAAAIINCNFTGSNRATMNWNEVTTLFHEAGHALHHLLSDQNDYAVSGMNLVEWDAVELPSQFMENFAWEPAVMAKLAVHQRTGRPLPLSWQRRLRVSRTFQSGLWLSRQLSFSAYDLALHEAPSRPDVLGLWSQIKAQYTVTPKVIQDRMPCSFGHIFAGGYDAGYYSYLWAEVMSADAYAMFSARGAKRKKLGRLFCQEVLSRGGSRPAAENFRALRGRDPDIQYLLKQRAIA